MQIPSLSALPTDNLYKFMALSGVTLVIASSVLAIQILLYTEREIDSLTIDIELLSVDIAEGEANAKSLAQRVKSLEERVKSLGERTDSAAVRSEAIAIPRPQVNGLLDEARQLRDETQQLSDEEKLQFEAEWKVERSHAALKSKSKLLRDEGVIRMVALGLCGLLALAGWRLSSEGFRRWYKLVQEPQDAVLAERSRRRRASVNRRAASDAEATAVKHQPPSPQAEAVPNGSIADA